MHTFYTLTMLPMSCKPPQEAVSARERVTKCDEELASLHAMLGTSVARSEVSGDSTATSDSAV